ncbi:hypothetical protein K4A83_12505 [Spirulina subsalsa FACHB-351]|uniref:Uncharacterized protein n=1 Tax=Spirulina subsalsa FACHB-351 TaxID=234711 RepID=A0ABT3L6K7_9CYAN|nr:hypothetical protein [Spirulina subsalsa]MCW6037082.1 hypothetical protein [Spirulina subsalsa FACHB-351]
MNKISSDFPLLLPGAFSDLYAQVSESGKLTLADRYGLMAALLGNSLGQDERLYIDRLLRGIRLGHIQIVDEISAISCASS